MAVVQCCKLSMVPACPTPGNGVRTLAAVAVASAAARCRCNTRAHLKPLVCPISYSPSPALCVGRSPRWFCAHRSCGRGVTAGAGGCRRLHTAPHPPPCSAACSAAARRRTTSPAPRAARAVVPAAHPTRLLLENESPAAASSICRCPTLPVRPRLLPHLVRALACHAGVCITWRGMAWRVC